MAWIKVMYIRYLYFSFCQLISEARRILILSVELVVSEIRIVWVIVVLFVERKAIALVDISIFLENQIVLKWTYNMGSSY